MRYQAAGLAGITLPGGPATNKLRLLLRFNLKFLEQFIEKNNLMPKLCEEYWDSETQVGIQIHL